MEKLEFSIFLIQLSLEIQEEKVRRLTAFYPGTELLETEVTKLQELKDTLRELELSKSTLMNYLKF